MQHTIRADQIKPGDTINLTGQPETVEYVSPGTKHTTVSTDTDDHVLDVDQTITVNR